MPKTLNRRPEPTWEIADLFPLQGDWSEEDYLGLETNRLIEYSHGYLEFLPMPTMSHQQIVAYLFGLLVNFVAVGDLGTVLFSALRVRVGKKKFREPDILFMSKAHSERMFEEYWIGADLVMEVVSGGVEDRRRDLITKRQEYARAKVGEYWIVDPLKERITVLRLSGSRYVVHGQFKKGETATSHSLQGFAVEVSAALAPAGKRKSRKP